MIFWDHPVDAAAARLLQRRLAPAQKTSTIQPPLLAWAWRIAVGDPAAEPRIAAHHEWLRGQPRPRGRRPAVDRPARRVRARLLAQVRPGLGPARARAARFPAPDRPQPPARLGRAPDPRGGGPVLCEVMTNVLWASRGSPLGEPSITPALVDRLGTSAAALPRRGAAAAARGPRSRPGRRSPRWRCPTCRRRSAGAWSRSTCSTRARYWPPVPPPSVSAAEPCFEPDCGPGLEAAATGAGRPGSTPPGCCGSACGGSATTAEADADGSSAWPSVVLRQGCASTTTRTTARASAPTTSPGPA